MAKNLRADMEVNQFHRFKRIKAELNLNTNDQVIEKLMDYYEDNNEN